jgi:signal peptidase II
MSDPSVADVPATDGRVTPPLVDGPPRWRLFVALGVLIVVLDQLAKNWINTSFTEGVPVPVVGDLIRITVSHNKGALFGLFQGSAVLFGLASLCVIGIIVWYESRAGSSLLVTLALGLLIGGALGNLTDRLRIGFVVDFVDAGIGTWRFYTFNVADAAISCSILLLILLAIMPARPARTA